MEIPRDIIGRYMQRREQDILNCLQFFSVKNYGALEITGHQLKGNGGTFGFAEISQIGQRLESAAQEHDDVAINAVLSEFSTWIKRQSS